MQKQCYLAKEKILLTKKNQTKINWSKYILNKTNSENDYINSNDYINLYKLPIIFN